MTCTSFVRCTLALWLSAGTVEGFAAPLDAGFAAGPETAAPFALTRKAGSGFLTSLRRGGDTEGVEFIRPGSALGPIELRVRSGTGPWREVGQGDDGLVVHSRLDAVGDSLRWEISVRNTGKVPLEIGDLALSLPMNTDYVPDHEETMRRRVFKHAFVAGNGSFVYWLPVKGTGAMLVMQSLGDTGLEFFTSAEMDYASGKERFAVFVHSRASAEQKSRGTWRQPRTGRVLKPGEEVSSSFAFHWAVGYDGVREVLYQQGGADKNFFTIREGAWRKSLGAGRPGDSLGARRWTAPSARRVHAGDGAAEDRFSTRLAQKSRMLKGRGGLLRGS